MATAIQSIQTQFGPATVAPRSTGQSMIHTLANWMWLPMILMGVMAIATSIALGIAQANVASDLGEQFTALRKANFETLKPLTAGTLFLGEALLLSGISFLLGTILGALRWGGGEVQESAGQPVKALKTPWSAKLFLMFMMAGLVAELVAFGTLVFVATQAHEAWIGAAGPDAAGNVAALDRATAFAAWADPLREVALGLLLAGIGLALYAISNVLGFQFTRIRELVLGHEEGGA